MLNKLCNLSKSLLFFVVGIVPYLIMQIVALKSLTAPEFKLLNWSTIALFILLFIDIYFLYYYRNRKLSIKLELLLLFKVCLFGLIVRIFIIYAFQTYPISDFSSVHNVSSGIVDSGLREYVNMFIHLFYHSKLLSFVFSIFGASIFIAQMVNCFFSIITMIFIYKISKIIFSSQTLAIIPVLLFNCDLSLASYTGVLAPEHISMAFLTIALYFIALVYKERLDVDETYKITIFYLLSGVFLVFSSMFKPIGIVIIIAIVLVELLRHIPSISLKDNNIKSYVYNILKKAIPVFALLLVYFLGNFLSVKYQKDSYTKLGYDTFNEKPLFSIVYHGLAFEGKGQWNPNVVNYINSVAREHNYNKKEINRELKEQLFNDFKIHAREYIPFIRNKLEISWDPGSAYIYWAYRDQSAPPINMPLSQYETTVTIRNISRCYYIMLSAFGLISSFFLCFKPKKIDDITFLLNMITFGSALLFILIEAQGRYKSAIYPVMIIVISYGAIITMKFIDKINICLFNKLSNKKNT